MTDALDPKTTAVLVMDMQNDIIGMLPDAKTKETLLERTAALLERAREAGVRVIYVGIGFRAGYPEVPDSNLPFAAAVRASGRFIEGAAGTEHHAAIAPKPNDVRVTKHRVSAFAGTDLEMILRANRIDTLVLTGVATSGIVLSTTRHAADADYRLVIAEDCCADRDDEVHRVLMQKILSRQAAVVQSGELFAS
jgi:nicotinamidase-related amidase